MAAISLVVAGALGAFGWLWWNSAKIDARFLPHQAPAEWVVYPSSASLSARPDLELATTFRRFFTLTEVPTQAVLRVAGFRKYLVAVNGVTVEAPGGSGRNWKQPDEVDISKQLRIGSNELAVVVWNSSGPPALWLVLEGRDASPRRPDSDGSGRLGEASLPISRLIVASDETWQCSYADAAWRPARLASKPKVVLAGNPIASGERPWASVRKCWPVLALFTALLSVTGLYSTAHRKHPTSNIEHPTSNGVRSRRHWMFDVGCSMLDVRASSRWVDALPLIVLAVLWVLLFANNLGVLPGLVGYDAAHHVEYVQYLVDHHALPLAGQGWEMFQPPLYYLIAATVVEVLGVPATGEVSLAALRLIGLGIGVAHFALIWASLRLLFPGQRLKQICGLVLAAFLPALLYLSHYVTNEALGAALVSGSIYLALRILKRPAAQIRNPKSEIRNKSQVEAIENEENSQTPKRLEHLGLGILNLFRISDFGFRTSSAYAVLGLCLGAALLAKSTALLAVPAIVGALVWKEIFGAAGMEHPTSNIRDPTANTEHRTSDTRRPTFGWLLWKIGVMLGACLVVCGWHYVRTWAHYGTPLIGVWDPRTGFNWWQDDGYRTSAYYLRFGDVLSYPWFGSLRSFWDGLYSTLWGDGLGGGTMAGPTRTPWNYDLMAVGYWLALAPTAAVLVGVVYAVINLIRRPSAEDFLLLSMAFLFAFALVMFSLTVPYYCNVKAIYALAGMVPLCAFGATGFDWLMKRGRVLCAILSVLFGLWAITSYASFWVLRSSSPARIARATSLVSERRLPEAVQVLQKVVEDDPKNLEARSLLIPALIGVGDEAEARRQADILQRENPAHAGAQLAVEAVLERQGLLSIAVEHARRALEVAPGAAAPYERLAMMLNSMGRYGEAFEVTRGGLAIAPLSPDLRLALGCALLATGDTNSSRQLDLAFELAPGSGRPHATLGATLAKLDRLDEAAEQYASALRLGGNGVELQVQYAAVLARQGKTEAAIKYYNEALRLMPDYVEALNNLAWIRAANANEQMRNGAEAVQLAERACQLTGYQEAVLAGTLAAAYAEAGRFEEATKMASKARELALNSGQTELAATNQKLIELFTARKAFREPKPGS